MTLLGKMVKDAKANGSGEWIRDGVYLFAVESIFEQKGYEGECCIAELRVLSAEPLVEGVKPNPVGSTCSVVFNVTKNKEAALGNIKKLFMGLFGIEEEDFTEELYAEYVDEKTNPARGMVIGCRTKQVINKGKVNAANRGMKMTVPGWETVEQTEDDVAKRRAELDKKAADKAASKPADTKPAEETKPAGATGKKLSFLNRPKG